MVHRVPTAIATEAKPRLLTDFTGAAEKLRHIRAVPEGKHVIDEKAVARSMALFIEGRPGLNGIAGLKVKLLPATGAADLDFHGGWRGRTSVSDRLSEHGVVFINLLTRGGKRNPGLKADKEKRFVPGRLHLPVQFVVLEKLRIRLG